MFLTRVGPNPSSRNGTARLSCSRCTIEGARLRGLEPAILDVDTPLQMQRASLRAERVVEDQCEETCKTGNNHSGGDSVLLRTLSAQP